MTITLEGRTAFITGGAQGIGLGIGRALATQGVKLAIADIDERALAKSTSRALGSDPDRVVHPRRPRS